MRLDKFLKLSRLVKRRTVANDLCDGGGALLDGKKARASAEVRPGQELTLRFGNRTVKVRIERVPEKNISPQEAETLYSLLEKEATDSPL
jgi:ribosomal 50S subunit-recycling heat shock protein